MGITGIRGCVFDFDGTIILSEPVHMRAWEDLAKAESLRLPDDFLAKSVGMSDSQCTSILHAAWHSEMSEIEILERKRFYYMQRCPEECVLVAGVSDTIYSLYDRGIPLALATSSSRDEVHPVLEQWGLLRTFSRLWTVEDVTHPKPDPEIYRSAAGSLGLEPRQCLAFEDSMAGVQSARAAGCQLITLQTLYDAEKLGPAVLSIHDYRDGRLNDVLKSIVR
jgi:HAD superfamily hydrolase (TIGR01509 family)